MQITIDLTYNGHIFYQSTSTMTVATNTISTGTTTLEFYPKNSAEIAMYEFTLENVTLQKGYSIMVQFGEEYMP